MKTFTLAAFVMLFSHVIDAQDITLTTASDFPATLTACQTDTFGLAVINNSDSTQAFTIDLKVGNSGIASTFQFLTAGGFTFSVSHDTVFISTSGLAPHATQTISYTLSSPCADIPTSGNVFSLGQIFSLTGTSFVINSQAEGEADTILVTWNYPVIVGPTGTYNITSSVGQSSTVNFNYTSTGDIPYNGNVNFTFTVGCSQVQVTSLSATLDGATILNLTNPTPGSPIPLTGLDMLVDSTLQFQFGIKLLSCITSPCTISTDLQWGCPGDLCKSITPNITVHPTDSVPYVVVARVTPGPCPGGGYEFAWDGSCVNTETQWEFLIVNRGSAQADTVAIDLAGGVGMYTYICSNSIEIDSVDPRFPNTYMPIVDTARFTAMTSADFPGGIPSRCFDALTGDSSLIPIKDFYLKLGTFQPGQNIVLRFRTWRCCADDNPFNTGINFNRWTLISNYWSCGTARQSDVGLPSYGQYWMDDTYPPLTTPTYFAYNVDNPNAGYISSNAYETAPPDLQLIQNFNQTTTDIYGSHGGCGAAQMFSIMNQYFTGKNPGVGDNTPSDYDTQLFCPYCEAGGLAGVTGAFPRGKFRVEWICQPGVSFVNLPAPFMSGGPYIWRPVTVGFDTKPYAIFDMDANFFNQAGVPVQGPNGSSYAFRDTFFINSTINFWLQGCCSDTSLLNPTVTVNTLFEPEIDGSVCDTCFIPLSQVPFQLQLLCPGCTTPGVIMTAYDMNRVSLGFSDSNDYGIADGAPLQHITPIYSAYNLLYVKGSIVGDTLQSVAKGFLVDGYGTGFSYAQWQAHWDSINGTTPFLSDLYFEEQIPNADSVGLECTGASITYYPAAGGPPCSWQIAGITPTSPFVFTATGKLVIHIPIDSLPCGITVAVNDSFAVTANYFVCHNPPHEIDLQINSEMYFSDAALGAADPYSHYSEVGQLDSAGGGGPGGYNPADSAIWICQGFAGVHKVYNIATSYQEIWNDQVSCTKYAEVIASYYINGPHNDMFPYEYRMMPKIDPANYGIGPYLLNDSSIYVHFFLPQGFKATVDSTFTECYTYNNRVQNPWIFDVVHGNYVDSPAAQTGPYSFNYHLNTTTAQYSPVFYSGISGFTDVPPNPWPYIQYVTKTSNGDPVLLMGDEMFMQGIVWEITPICNSAHQLVDTIPADSVYAVIPQFDTACTTPDTNLVLDNGITYTLSIPHPTINTHALTATLTGQYFDAPITLNVSTGDISNFVFYMLFPIDRLPQGDTVICLSTQSGCNGTVYPPQMVIGTDTFWEYSIGNLTTTSDTFHWQIYIDNCDSLGDTLHIPVYYFWSCDGKPETLPPLGNLCDQPDSIELNLSMPPVRYSQWDTIFAANNQWSSCNTIYVYLELSSLDNGGIGDLLDSLFLPPHFTLIGSYYGPAYGGPFNTLPFVNNGLVGSDSLLIANLIPLTSFSDTSLAEFGPNGLRQPNHFFIQLRLNADCHADSLAGLKFIYNGKLYCGETFDEEAAQNPGEFQRVIYTFPTIHIDSNACGPFVYPTASACTGLLSYTVNTDPSGHAGNPYGVLPDTITWSWAPLDTIQKSPHSNASYDNISVAGGTYTVTVTDANGCSNTATVTVNYDSITQTHTNDSCYGEADGTVTLNIFSGAEPFTFIWNNGDTTQNVTGLGAGIYKVTAIDSLGCSLTLWDTITQPDTLTVSTTSTISCTESNNGTATAIVTGGTGPYTYAWGTVPPQYTDTATNLPGGLYFVTVTDANGCTAIANVSVISFTPSVTVYAGPNPACPGSWIKVAASGGFTTYSWAPIDEGNVGVFVTTIDTTTTYSVTATDDNGCSATDSATVYVYPQMTISETHTESVCVQGNYGVINISIAGDTATPFTFLWSTGDTSQDLAHLLPGIYAVTVTDSNGCSAADTITIAKDLTCCASDTSLGSDSLTFGSITAKELMADLGMTSNVLVLGSLQISFSGTFTIDTNFFIIASNEVTFGPGATMVVLSGDTLTLNKDSLRACDDYLWKGIMVNGGGALYMASCEIQDAQYAVRATNNSAISIMKNTFYKNFIGFYYYPGFFILGYTGTLHMLAPFTLNQFLGETLLPVYPGMTNGGLQPPIAQTLYSWAGVELMSLHSFIVGNRNTFYKLANGVVSYNTNLNVGKNYFIWMQPYGYSYSWNSLNYQGNGIITTGYYPAIIHSYGAPTKTFIEQGFGFGSPNFINCYNSAITADRMNVRVDSNNISDYSGPSVGIKVRNSAYGKIWIYGNFMSTQLRGIQLLQNDPLLSERVHDNTIYIVADSLSGMAYGIEDQEGGNTQAPGTARMYSNIVEMMDNAQYGILVNHSNGLECYFNEVHMNIPKTNYVGIGFQSCQVLNDHCNFVKGDSLAITPYSATDSVDFPVGIHYFSCGGIDTNINMHSCNFVRDIWTGMRFTGPNLHGSIRSNFFNYDPVYNIPTGTCNVGLLVDSSASIDQQVNQGNEWDGTYGSWGARNNNLPLIVSFQEFLVRTFAAPFVPPASPAGWFSPSFSGIDSSCPYVCKGDFHTLTVFSDSDKIGPSDTAVMRGPTTLGLFAEPLCWQNQKLVYEKLKCRPGLIATDSTTQAFYTGKDTSATGALSKVAALQDSATVPDSVTAAQLGIAQDSIESDDSTLISLDSALTALVDTMQFINDSINAQSLTASIDSIIAQLILSGDTPVTLSEIMSSLSSSASAILSKLKQPNGAVTDTTTFASLTTASNSTKTTLSGHCDNAAALRRTFDSGRASSLVSAASKNSTIATSVDIEQYHQSAYDIYLNGVAKSNLYTGIVSDTTGYGEDSSYEWNTDSIFTSDQISILYSLAFQCPLAGGEAVFKARAMLSLVIDTFYNDLTLCNTAGYQLDLLQIPPKSDTTSTIIPLSAKLYPNPARDYVLIQFNQNLVGMLTLEVYDATGRIVFAGDVTLFNGTYVLNTQTYSSGLYYLRISDVKQKLFSSSFAIMQK